MKKVFALILWRRDRTIDVAGVGKLVIGFLYIRKGRTLTITGVDPSKNFIVEMSHFSRIKGSVRLAKKPQEISVEELRALSESNASQNVEEKN